MGRRLQHNAPVYRAAALRSFDEETRMTHGMAVSLVVAPRDRRRAPTVRCSNVLGVDWDKIIVAIAGLMVVSLQFVREWAGREGRSARIKRDLEILALLPEESEAYTRLQGHIETSIARMLSERTQKRRSLNDAVQGLVLLGLGIWVTTLEAPFFLIGVPLACAGAFMLIVGVVPLRRGPGGSILWNDPDSKG